MENFESLEPVREATPTRKIYKIQMNILKRQLEEAKKYPIASDNPLLDAKQIFLKYTKGNE